MIKKLVKIFIHLFSVFLFFAVTSYVLLAAYGYQIDLLERDIFKTSIVDVQNKLQDIELLMDGEVIASKIPYQVKNVTPGAHLIEIKKEGYLPWKKQLEVHPDLASIIDSVFLIPNEFEGILSEIAVDFKYNIVVSNDQFIVYVSSKEKKIHIVKIDSEEKISFEHINFPLDTLDREIDFISEIHLAFIGVEDIVVLNLQNKDTKIFQKPVGSDKFYVAYTPDLRVFYSKDDYLYVSDIDNENEELIYENAKESDLIFDINVISGNAFVNLPEGFFRLSNKGLTLIDNKLNKDALYDYYNDDLIYVKTPGEIVGLNLLNNKKKLLARFSMGIKGAAYFNDGKNVIIDSANEISICEIDFTLCTKLLEIEEQDEVVVFPSNYFFILKSDAILYYSFDSE